MPKDSFAAIINNWERLAEAVKKDEGSPPHVAELGSELAMLREQTILAKTQHMSRVAEALTASRHLQESIEYGRSLESRLRNLVKGLHGSDSAQLYRYGIQPRREPRKPKGKEEEKGEAPSSS